MLKPVLITVAILLSASSQAFAHPDPQEHGSLVAGLSHPLLGVDHVLAMVAVGLWAAQSGGRALFFVPLAFVITMGLGFRLAVSGFDLPFVEPAILASVIGIGLLVAIAAKLPAAASCAVVGAFALFHGHAHGGELGSAGVLQFGMGFMMATAGLHIVGIALGLVVSRAGAMASRTLGAITALAGLSLAFGI